MAVKNPILQPVFGKVRIHAAAASSGPHNIVIREAKGENFYGWATLTLEARSAKSDIVESRTIYANLFNREQSFAVLRAAFWDGLAARKAFKERLEFREHPEKFPVVLPARFVKISTRKLRNWLSEISGIRIEVDGTGVIDSKVDLVRKIRIERDYVACVFEKVWQAEDRDHAMLNKKWHKVWTASTHALMTAPMINGLNEDFGLTSPKFRYDFDAFQPNLLV